MPVIDPVINSTTPEWFYLPSDGSESSPRRAEELKMALTSDLRDFIAMGFAGIPEVEMVYTLRHAREEIVYVRVVVPRSDRAVRDKIYDQEKEIIDAFSIFDFDFGIVSSADAVDPTLKLVYKRS